MTAAWARHALVSAVQGGPAGAVTDHSDCSGTAGIASIDNRLLAIGRRVDDSTAGAEGGQTSAGGVRPSFPPFPACGDVRDSPQSHRARIALRRAWGAKPNDAKPALHGVTDAICAS